MIVLLLRGVIAIRLAFVSKKSEVRDFLNNLKSILEDEEFDSKSNFMLIRSSKEYEEYSTPFTLLDLDYGSEDVIERIKELTIENYSESLVDRDNLEPLAVLFVFGKDINERLVYIKLRIKGIEKRMVVCVSFHYAKEQMSFPYAK